MKKTQLFLGLLLALVLSGLVVNNVPALGQSVADPVQIATPAVINQLANDLLSEEVEFLPGIPKALIEDSGWVDLINAVQLHYTKADLAATALFGPDFRPKPTGISRADLADISQFTNTLVTLKLNGKQLKAYLEWSARFYNTAKPGDLTVSFNPQVQWWDYDMVAGINYEINIAAPVGKRIENLTFKGKPVTDSMTFSLTVSNYRFNQLVKEGYFNQEDLIADSAQQFGNNGRLCDLIAAYIENRETIIPKVDHNWKITGIDFEHPLKAIVYEKVKSGAISIPALEKGRIPNIKSLNVYELIKNGQLDYEVVDILSINDLHGSLLKSGKNVGIANLVNEVKIHRAANPNTIFVAAGDLFQGSAESNLLYGKPVAAALKEAGLVASAIGNHEYDWGTGYFTTWEKEGGFPFLAANIYDRTTGKPVAYAKPYHLIKLDNGIKVAFIGLATPETAYKTNPEIVKDLEFKDPVTVLPQFIKEVRAAGANLVIALTHLGAVQDQSGVITGEAADLAEVNGLDGIIAGHTHETIAGKVGNVPVVMAYYNGRSLGKLTFVFAKGAAKPVAAQAKVDQLYLRQATLREDSATQNIVTKYLAQVQPILAQKIGVTKVDLKHDPKAPSLMGEWVCEVMRYRTGAQIAFQNGGGLRVSLPKGNLTIGDLYTLIPFDNTMVTAKLTGAQIIATIENGLGNPKLGYFGQTAGLLVEYDLSQPFGQRVIKIRLENGEPLLLDQLYTVVANDFMFSGGDEYTVLKEAQEIKDTGIPLRESLIEYIKEQKEISPVYKGNQKPYTPVASKPAA